MNVARDDRLVQISTRAGTRRGVLAIAPTALAALVEMRTAGAKDDSSASDRNSRNRAKSRPKMPHIGGGRHHENDAPPPSGGDPIPVDPTPPEPGQFCGACKDGGVCDEGLVCAGQFCGDPDIMCAGNFWACGRKSQMVCETDKNGVEKATCQHRHEAGRRRRRFPDRLCGGGSEICWPPPCPPE